MKQRYSGGVSLTVEEAGHLLSAHPNTVRNLIRDKELDAWKLGRHWRIEERALEDYKTRQRVGRPKVSRLRAVEGER